MNNIINGLNLENLNTITYILKTFFISICTYYAFCKIINKKFLNFKLIIVIISNLLISTLCALLSTISTSLMVTVCLVFLLSLLFSLTVKCNIGHSILITIISLGFNYILFFISVIINFIPSGLLSIQNHNINLLLMSSLCTLLLFLFFKIRRFKNGFMFLQRNLKNELFDALILNISIAVLFSCIILSTSDLQLSTNLIISLVIYSLLAIVTIQKTLTMYYKHNLLVKELNETKLELEESKKEISKLEAENLSFSKVSHSIAHKQKSLEHKLDKLMLNTEFSSELDIHNRINKLSNECFKTPNAPAIPKTNIEIIDDMLSYMESECSNNNIDFELQLNGNIHYMINNFITQEELEILLADHIKDAIISINCSDNINKSILVKLGLIDGFYSIIIYDTGIEFEISTLLDLGIKPSTTHSDNGGTGIGFMNTFDVLKKYNASLYIKEISKPSKENYTKYICIKFDNKSDYRIISYRSNEIKESNTRNDLIVE